MPITNLRSVSRSFVCRGLLSSLELSSSSIRRLLRSIIALASYGEDYVVPSTIDDPASLDEIRKLVVSDLSL
jgi:hypothetical protein